MFAFPAEIRRLIYTTNSVEGYNRQLRKVVKTKGSFPSAESVRKLLYLVNENVTKKWSMPLRDWAKILNQLAIVAANLALDGLESLLGQNFPAQQGEKIHLIRYADDFVISGTTKDVLQDEVRPLVQSFLQERGLSLSVEKTSITHIERGFDFLGQNIRKYGGKLLIKPSAKSQKMLLRKVREIITTEGRHLSTYGLITKLNPVIRGWANYHRHVVSKEVFARIDSQINRALWRWAKRRHRQKPASWVRKKYFDEKVSQRSIFHTHCQRRRYKSRHSDL